MTGTPDPDEPQLDDLAWPRRIQELGVPSLLVTIESWMGPDLRSRMGPEDVWQETLWMAWRDRRQHRWTDRRAFRSWLLGIARNRIRNLADHESALRRGGGVKPMSLDPGDPNASRPGEIPMPAATTTPSRMAWFDERARRIRSAIDALPERYSEVVRLRLLEELPMREVALRLGIGLSTAKERFLAGALLYRRELIDLGCVETRFLEARGGSEYGD